MPLRGSALPQGKPLGPGPSKPSQKPFSGRASGRPAQNPFGLGLSKLLQNPFSRALRSLRGHFDKLSANGDVSEPHPLFLSGSPRPHAR